MVLCIIGVTSTYIFLNTSILSFIKVKENPIESNFKVLSEESIIRGKSIQWFASSNGSKFYAINQNEELLEEIFIDEFRAIKAVAKDRVTDENMFLSEVNILRKLVKNIYIYIYYRTIQILLNSMKFMNHYPLYI